MTSDGTLDWLSSADECEWFGISCNGGKVTELDWCKCQTFDLFDQYLMYFHEHLHCNLLLI